MVTTASERSIEINLRTVDSAVSDLPLYAEAPQEWTGWDAEWPDVMARLEWLLQLRAEGKLDAEQRLRCEELLQVLLRELPLVVKLKLCIPDAVLQALDGLVEAA